LEDCVPMKTMPRVAVVLCALVATSGAWGQIAEEPWRYSASISYYDLPKYQDYWNPIVTADQGRVHLEGRYNYLSIDSGSPASWCRLGLAVQLTNALVATRSFQRGPVVAFSFKNFELEADVLDPDRDDATYILSLSMSF